VDINYLVRDYEGYKKGLVELGKTYFPGTNLDYSDTSPISLLTSMNAYVGDILSFYTDKALKESNPSTANSRTNMVILAKNEGVTLSLNSAATVFLDFYQLIPSKELSGSYVPDEKYGLQIRENAIVSSTDNNTSFRTLTPVDFKSPENRISSVYSYDTVSGEPTYFLMKKTVSAVSGEVKTVKKTFTSAKPYDKIIIDDTDVSGILDIVDSTGTKWYEVSSLAQDTILIPVPNVERYSPTNYQFQEATPYLLKGFKTAKRFITRLNSNAKLEIQFGSGTSTENSEDLVPNQKSIGLTSADFTGDLDTNIDAENFLKTNTYGQAPANIELTVRYVKNYGLRENVGANLINNVRNLPILIDEAGLDQTLLNKVRSSVTVNNPNPATGASGIKTREEIQQSMLKLKNTQKRAVTREDYLVRAQTMPPRFGSIAKVYLTKDDFTFQDSKNWNPLALNLYVLSLSSEGKFVEANNATKSNLATYLEKHRVVTDAINIRNLKVINLSLDYSISVEPRFNNEEVLLQTLAQVKNMLTNSKMEPNSPILLGSIRKKIESVAGVLALESLTVYNKTDADGDYSLNRYSITKALRNGILYPAKSPSIFEFKFPDNDIRGKVVSPGTVYND
jgi:hypothetical protein